MGHRPTAYRGRKQSIAGERNGKTKGIPVPKCLVSPGSNFWGQWFKPRCVCRSRVSAARSRSVVPKKAGTLLFLFKGETCQRPGHALACRGLNADSFVRSTVRTRSVGVVSSCNRRSRPKSQRNALPQARCYRAVALGRPAHSPVAPSTPPTSFHT